jgi:hypothetical protein
MRRSVAFVSALAVVCSAGVAARAQDALAPSCQSLFTTFAFTAKPEPGSLLAVVDGKLVEANSASFRRGAEHQFHYVFQSAACEPGSCVTLPIISIKTQKVTKSAAPTEVALSREGNVTVPSIRKSDYDAFHQDAAIRPIGPFLPLNDFHISYDTPAGVRLHTHLPRGRRETYLFTDVPTGKSPWFTARNYRFTRDPNGQPQCIRFTARLQQSTVSVDIEIAEIEDSEGGASIETMDRWSLTLK